MRIIGKVALKVWPDLRKFREELKRDLKTATEGVEAEIPLKINDTQAKRELVRATRQLNQEASAFPVRIPVQLDFSSVVDDRLRGLIDRLQAQADVNPVEIKTNVEDALLPDRDIEIDVNAVLDNDTLEKTLQQIDSFLGDHAVEVDVDLDLDNATLEKTFAEIERWVDHESTTIHLDVDVDRDALESSLANIRKDLGLLGRAEHDLHMVTRIKPVVDSVSSTFADAGLAVLARAREVKLRPVIDNAATQALAGALSRLTGYRLMMKKIMAFDFLKDLDLALPRIALLTTGIGNAVTMALALVGAVLNVGQGIAQIAPLALALPGVFAGMVTSAVAFGLALSEINKRFPELSTQLARIKAANNNAFWNEATVAFRELTSSWIPKFTDGMRLVGVSAGIVFSGLLKNLNEVVTPRLPEWFAATARGLAELGRATPAMANITKHFGDLGAIYFPRMSAWMARIIQQFSAWLDFKSSTGELTKMIDRAIKRIQELWAVAKGLGGILYGLADAAEEAGSDGLGDLARGLQGLSNKIRTTKVHDLLVGMFEGANEGVANFLQVGGPGLERFFTGFATALHDLGGLVGTVGGLLVNGIGNFLGNPKVLNGLGLALDGLRGALTQMQVLVDPLAASFEGLAELVGTAFRSFAPLLTEAFAGVGNAADGLLDSLNKTLPGLASGFLDIFRAVEPAIRELTPVVGDFIEGLGSTISKAMTNIAPDVKKIAGALTETLETNLPKVQALIDTLISKAGDLVKKYSPELEDAIKNAGNAMGKLAEGIDKALNGDADGSKGAFHDFIESLKRLDADTEPILTDAQKAINKGLTEFFKGAGEEIARQYREFADRNNAEIQKFLDGIGPTITNWNQQLGRDMQAAWDGFWDENLIQPLKEGGEGFKQAWINLGNEFALIGNSFAQGLDGAARSIGQWFMDLGTNIGTWWSTNVQPALDAAAQAWDGFLKSIFGGGEEGSGGSGSAGAGTAGKPAVINLFDYAGTLAGLTGFTTEAQAAWDGFWGTANASSETGGSGIVAAIGQKLTEAKTAVDQRLGEMKSAFETNWNDIKSTVTTKLIEVALAIGSKLNEAKTKVDSAWAEVKRITQEAWDRFVSTITERAGKALDEVRAIPGRITAALGNLGGLLEGSGASLMEGFARGVRNAVGTVTGAVDWVLSRARAFFPNSPAKEGPFSGKGWVSYSGEAVSAAFGQGISDESSTPRQAALRMAAETRAALEAAASSSSAPVTSSLAAADAAPAGGGDSYVFHLEVDMSDITQINDLIEWMDSMRRKVRAQGG